MSNRKALGVIAGLIMLVGLTVGLWQHSIPLDYQPADGAASLSCGSAFHSNSGAAEAAELGRYIRQAFEGGELTASAEQYQAQCSDAMSTARVAAWVLLIGGGLLLLFLFLTGQHKTRWDPPAAAPEGSESSAPPAP